MARVVHFEIHAADVERCRRFYESTFGWQVQQWGEMEYWGVVTGSDDEPGINGGLVPRRGPPPAEGQPVNSYVCTVNVDDVDATVEAAVAHGGSVGVPKMAIPGVGWLAYCKDTEGNIFGLMQDDPGAA